MGALFRAIGAGHADFGAAAAAVAPFADCGILFAAVWGIAFYREYRDIWTDVGALVIVLAGLYVWHHERATAATA